MKGPLANSEHLAMDFEPLPIQSVALSQRHFDQAVEISDRVVTESRKWQTYLNALALFGFQEWFTEHVPDLVLDWRQCSLFRPQYANLVEAAYAMRVNGFELCLISTGGAIDSFIKLPRAVVDLADFRAHLYIVVQVLEEQGQVQVLSFMRYDQWLAYQQSQALQPEPDWSYRVPIRWFDSNLQRLLLHLECLEPEAVSLSDATSELPARSPLQRELSQRLARANSLETSLWQLVTWQEGVQILTSPPLVDWLYQVQTGQQPLVPESGTASPLLQPILNAGAWLRNELDDAAQALGWMLLPPFAELRGGGSDQAEAAHPLDLADPPVLQFATEEINLIRKKLGREGASMPANARCVFKDLSLAEVSLRLYVITWLLQDDSRMPVEWALLPILKNLSGENLRHSVKLSVKDQVNLLVEHQLTSSTESNFIYAHLMGELDEAFLITITLDSGETLTLPPFAFHRGEPQ